MLCLLCRELFPSSRCLFIYRDVEKVARSISRSSLVVPSMVLVCKLGKLSHHVSRLLDGRKWFGLQYAYGQRPYARRNVVSSYNYCLPGHASSRIWRQGTALWGPYRSSSRHVSSCLGVLSPAGVAGRAAWRSKRSRWIHRATLCLPSLSLAVSRNPRWHEREMKAKLNEILKKYRVPLIGEPGIIEGTLTCS